MHELGITRDIVAIVSEHAKGSRVLRVALEIGKLSAVMPDSIRFCFDVCSKGTQLEGADLEIIETPACFVCQECSSKTKTNKFFIRCDCGSTHLECIAGQELKIKEMEIA